MLETLAALGITVALGVAMWRTPASGNRRINSGTPDLRIRSGEPQERIDKEHKNE